MSRGAGHVGRAIKALFEADPSGTFSTDELVAAVYPGVNHIEKKHRVAVHRAAKNLMTHMPQWKQWQCERRGYGGSDRGSVFVNVSDLHSYAIGRLRTDFLHARTSVDELTQMLNDDERTAALVAPGGPWWLHVEQAKSSLGVTLDEKTQRQIAAQEESFKGLKEGLAEAFGGKVAPEERARKKRRQQANQLARLCGNCGKDIASNEPVARPRVMGKRMFGWGSSIETMCLACAGDMQSGQWMHGDCTMCGRQVYDLQRHDRRRMFCCEDCRRRWKNRNPQPEYSLPIWLRD
jgi:hypothetical protein